MHCRFAVCTPHQGFHLLAGNRRREPISLDFVFEPVPVERAAVVGFTDQYIALGDLIRHSPPPVKFNGSEPKGVFIMRITPDSGASAKPGRRSETRVERIFPRSGNDPRRNNLAS